MCMEDRINKTSGEKAAATRAANTRRELEFIAGAYWDCAQFVFNSGFRDIGIVNNQFTNMLNNYVSAGKIKRESYNKFLELTLSVDVTQYCKVDFINAIRNAFDKASQMAGNLAGPQLLKEFNQFLNKCNITIDDAKRKVLYLQLMYGIYEATGNSAIKEVCDN